MFNTLLVKSIAAFLLVAAILASIYAGYTYIKDIGYNEAVAVYAQRDKDNAEKLEQHIRTLETLSTTIVNNNQQYLGTLDKNIKDILFKVKGFTPYTVVNGKCIPSAEFTDAYNKIISKANE